MEVLFWLCAGAMAYVYVGYPLLLFLVSRVVRRRVAKAPVTPTVTMVIAAYNEERAIAKKLENSLALDYPADRLDILVASDGSNDGTNRIAREYAARHPGRVTLLDLPRGGKTVGQNRAAEIARGEILVFSDATTMYDRGAVRAMVANYADPRVGSVGGDVRYVRDGEEASAKGRQMYWSYEASIRRWESRIFTVIGATGCIYSMRKSLYTRLDPAAISDFVQPARALLKGYRSVVEDSATCWEVAESKRMSEELTRRARVVSRGIRGVGFMREALNPLRHPFLLFQLISHRLLRWGIPFLLILAFVANAFLLDHRFYRLIFVGQIAFYGAALAGLALDRLGIRPRGAFIPLYFCLVNLAPLLAVWSLLKGEKKIVWETNPQAP
ncbi:MAG: glycosyltransferase family 2 protein [Deltaproteobacteria bacterium]|nr:glycosyltransferase family 2 protein [Deltaproteobacteria bacterium]